MQRCVQCPHWAGSCGEFGGAGGRCWAGRPAGGLHSVQSPRRASCSAVQTEPGMKSSAFVSGTHSPRLGASFFKFFSRLGRYGNERSVHSTRLHNSQKRLSITKRREKSNVAPSLGGSSSPDCASHHVARLSLKLAGALSHYQLPGSRIISCSLP